MDAAGHYGFTTTTSGHGPRNNTISFGASLEVATIFPADKAWQVFVDRACRDEIENQIVIKLWVKETKTLSFIKEEEANV